MSKNREQRKVEDIKMSEKEYGELGEEIRAIMEKHGFTGMIIATVKDFDDSYGGVELSRAFTTEKSGKMVKWIIHELNEILDKYQCETPKM